VAFVQVAALREVPERSGRRVELQGRTIGLYRVGDRVCALDDVCPHAGYSLSEGELTGTRIVCPAHGWEFDVVTGLAPGEIEEEPLERFAVRIEDGQVFVDLDDPL
jgi:nitrite reductase/ring-hydroxylating ferredoxin subunit